MKMKIPPLHVRKQRLCEICIFYGEDIDGLRSCTHGYALPEPCKPSNCEYNFIPVELIPIIDRYNNAQ